LVERRKSIVGEEKLPERGVTGILSLDNETEKEDFFAHLLENSNKIERRVTMADAHIMS
jgi:hypothetical protein